eukprot:TRINITY_DN76_c0_g1_i5.p1 TRINITY_DN76_c0_g1~~TRINITY_DN76_c0_g1_i5.p1  ORF type:complete len:335 (+),score=89.57 TRINITY_DN76_c0_g1_i5:66-1070(+)
MLRSLVGSEMCIRDRYQRRVHGDIQEVMNKKLACLFLILIGIHFSVADKSEDEAIENITKRVSTNQGCQKNKIPDTLKKGSSLNAGEYLQSTNGGYYAVLQTDGNFVLYISSAFAPYNALFNTKTHDQGKQPHRLTLQNDGNLVLYDIDNKPLWASNTFNGHRLTIQDDGNLVLYAEDGQVAWASNTDRTASRDFRQFNERDTLYAGQRLNQGDFLRSESGNYYAVMQGDGNFVVYVSRHWHHKNALWSTRTNGQGSAPRYVILQNDGNLVLYDTKRPLWASGTNGQAAYRLIIQNDGNLVIYDKSGKALWHSDSYRNRRHRKQRLASLRKQKK